MGPSVVCVTRDIWHESKDKSVSAMCELDKI